MASFRLDAFGARGGSLRPGHNQDAQANRQSKTPCVAGTFVCARLDFTGNCAQLSTARTRRAIVLGTYDPARDSDVDLGPAARTRASADCILVGIAPSLARDGRAPRAFTNVQERLGIHFGPALGMVGVRPRIVDLAYSISIRSNTAQ